jgi:hypothetical protein
MVRAQWMPAMVSAALLIAVAFTAERASAGHVAPHVGPIASEVSGFIVKVHGTHRSCRHGSYGKSGTEVGWHRHDRGKAYPCVPESTGTQPYSSPTDRRVRQGPGAGTPAARPDAPGSPIPEKKTGVSVIPKTVPTPSPLKNPSISNPPKLSPSPTMKRK